MFVDGLILYCLAAVLDLQPRVPMWPGYVRAAAVGMMIFGAFSEALGIVLKYGTLDLWEMLVQ